LRDALPISRARRRRTMTGYASVASDRAPISDPVGAVRWSLDMGLPDPTTFPRVQYVALVERALAEPDPPLLYGGPGRDGIGRGHAGLRAALAERAGVQLVDHPPA